MNSISAAPPVASPLAGAAGGSRRRSGLLPRGRRYLVLAALALLAAPLIIGLLKPDSPEIVQKENRSLAPLPRVPANSDEWAMAPKAIEAYLQDHFGLRHLLIRLYGDLTRPLGLGNSAVLIGRGGRLFYLWDSAVLQSAGLLVRDPQVADAAALLARVNTSLAARGTPLLVAVPPNAATIYRDFLPGWARNNGRRTEYDLLLDDLKAKGVRAVDLRPALEAARATGSVFFMHDTHWTFRGALAGYNAIVEADGHSDWRIDPRTALGPPTTRPGGDLARMLGFDESATEPVEYLTLPTPKAEPLPSRTPVYPDYVATGGKPGPTILIIGIRSHGTSSAPC